MGGRGNKSNISSKSPPLHGVDITTKDGKTTRYYFEQHNGTNFYWANGEMPKPTPLNMPESEFKRRAKSNGATIKKVSKAEIQRSKEARAADRKATNEFLNHYDVSNREMSRGSRANAIQNRANKRIRRH